MKKEELRTVKVTHGPYIDSSGYFHGIFQYADSDGAEPYAIIELPSGKVIEVAPAYIKFED